MQLTRAVKQIGPVRIPVPLSLVRALVPAVRDLEARRLCGGVRWDGARHAEGLVEVWGTAR